MLNPISFKYQKLKLNNIKKIYKNKSKFKEYDSPNQIKEVRRSDEFENILSSATVNDNLSGKIDVNSNISQ